MDLRKKSSENISLFKIVESSTIVEFLVSLGNLHFFDELPKESILNKFKFLMRYLEEDNPKKCRKACSMNGIASYELKKQDNWPNGKREAV